MEIEKTIFEDAFVINPKVWHDGRGYFYEVFHKEKFADIGLDFEFVQDNLSYSKRGVLRGLHFQWNPHQGKLVRAVQGKIYDVIVDIRPDSPTFKQWYGVELSDENNKFFWVPAGFAHSFVVLSDEAIVEYKCTGLYSPGCEGCIRYDDLELGIEWPINDVIVSDKDKVGLTLSEWLEKPEFQEYLNTLPENPQLK